MEITVAVLYLLPFWKLLEPSWHLSKPFHFGIRVSIWEASMEKLFRAISTSSGSGTECISIIDLKWAESCDSFVCRITSNLSRADLENWLQNLPQMVLCVYRVTNSECDSNCLLKHTFNCRVFQLFCIKTRTVREKWRTCILHSYKMACSFTLSWTGGQYLRGTHIRFRFHCCNSCHD